MAAFFLCRTIYGVYGRRRAAGEVSFQDLYEKGVQKHVDASIAWDRQQAQLLARIAVLEQRLTKAGLDAT